MVNIFIDLPALLRVLAFHENYGNMVDAYAERNPEQMWKRQQDLARDVIAVQRDLRRIGMGSAYLFDPPIMGGRGTPADIALLMANWNVAQKYHLDPEEMVLTLQIAIGEYQRRVKKGFFLLFWPFWWLELILTFIFRLPFRVARLMGFNSRDFESSLLGKFVKVLWAGAATIIGVIGALASMEQVKWLDGIWQLFR